MTEDAVCAPDSHDAAGCKRNVSSLAPVPQRLKASLLFLLMGVIGGKKGVDGDAWVKMSKSSRLSDHPARIVESEEHGL
jgi:hypothetical protein